MNILIEGIKVGLILCFLIGPIFFALVQTGVEEGLRAGTAVGLGIWISDLIFILGVYRGISYINRITAWDKFSLTLGLGGSAVLILFGLGALLRPPAFDYYTLPYTQRTSSYASLFTKGFLINTVNTFTVFFWMGLMSTVIVKNGLEGNDATLFFGGILGTIAFTDFLKVVLSKKIRQHLRPFHLLWLRRISGVALIVFGVILIVRVILTEA